MMKRISAEEPRIINRIVLGIGSIATLILGTKLGINLMSSAATATEEREVWLCIIVQLSLSFWFGYVALTGRGVRRKNNI